MIDDMMDFFVEVWIPVGAILLSLVLVFGGLMEAYGRYTCGNFQKITGKQTKWAMIDACYIKTDAGWQRWDEYTRRAITNEGQSHEGQ